MPQSFTIWLEISFSKKGIRCKAAFLFIIFYLQQLPAQDQPESVYLSLQQAAISQARFDDAINIGEKYYAQAEKRYDTRAIFESLMSMMEIYRRKGDYTKYFYYAEKLLEISNTSGNSGWLAESEWAMGKLNLVVNNQALALKYFTNTKSLIFGSLLEDWQNQGKMNRFYLDFARLYCQLRLFDSAWRYFSLLQPVVKNIQPEYNLRLGEYYYSRGNYDEAHRHFEKAGDGNDEYDLRTEALIGLSTADLALDHAGKARQAAREALSLALAGNMNAYIRDSYYLLSGCFEKLGLKDSSDAYFRKYIIYKDQVLGDQLKGRIASYEYEQKLAVIRAKARASELQLQKESLWRKTLVAGIIMLFILAVVLIRINVLGQKNEEKKRIIAENSLRIQTLESEKKQVEWLQQKTDLELKALQAQMNPHFIFNCLNSINSYIIRHQSTEAADYLTKFARLTRMVLENSGRQYISLEDELQGLKWYMDLENIRLDRPFTYTIRQGDVDISSLSITPLVLQPFVENAIWHGLHPLRTRQGRIMISFYMMNESLMVEIKDNGVGRKISGEMKKYASANSVSMGIDLTERRLALADTGSDGRAVVIEDIIEEDGTVGGTAVHLTIAVKQL